VRIPRKSVCRLLVLFGMTVALAACGPSHEDLDAAYDAGYDAAWREKCRGQVLPLMMPSQFDDSTGSGRLVSMYRSGYAEGKNDPGLCG
jgi:hypothetical protein